MVRAPLSCGPIGTGKSLLSVLPTCRPWQPRLSFLPQEDEAPLKAGVHPPPPEAESLFSSPRLELSLTGKLSCLTEKVEWEKYPSMRVLGPGQEVIAFISPIFQMKTLRPGRFSYLSSKLRLTEQNSVFAPKHFFLSLSHFPSGVFIFSGFLALSNLHTLIHCNYSFLALRS